MFYSFNDVAFTVRIEVGRSRNTLKRRLLLNIGYDAEKTT